MKPDPKKDEAIEKMENPKSKENLHRFLGMITYLSKFIPNLSQTAAPLRTLPDKDTEWNCGPEHTESINRLKKAVTEASVLQYFDQTKQVKISVDASSKGLGAVLLQNESPIAYASKTLTRHQAKLCTDRKGDASYCFRMYQIP